MAKWKNVALISTIVAPLAFGVAPMGEAFAQAERPTNTDVAVHKMEKATTGSDSQNVLWNSGDLKDGTWMTDHDWHPALSANFEFTAIQLNTTAKSVITGMDKDSGAPVFDDKMTVLTYGGEDYTWAKLLSASLASGYTYTNNKDADGKTKPSVSDYTVTVNLPGTMTEAAFITAVETFTSNKAVVEHTNASDGVANFADLDNGQWLIFETSKDDDVKEKSVPMFLNLPTQKPDATAADKWYADNTADTLHLYPKNYTDSGNVLVDKTDDQTGESVIGAWVGLFQGLNDDMRKKVLTALADVEPTTTAATIIDILKGSSVGLTDAQIIGVQQTGTGGTLFSDLKPGETYQVLELVEPEGYLINPTMSEFTLSDADDTSTDTDANDGTVHYRGGTYTLNNFEPNVTKQVKIESTTTKDDTTQGVDRGQDFDWLINAELPKDTSLITPDTTYTFTDTVPYQTNWTGLSVDIAQLGEMFTVVHHGWTGQGGNTGHHVSYDNQSSAGVTYWDREKGGEPVVDTADGHTEDAAVTVEVSDADFTNVKNTGVALPSSVTDAASWRAWLDDNVHISGYSSYYEYVDGGRTIKGKGTDAPTNGKLEIALTPAAQILFAQIANSNKSAAAGYTGLNITMGARANSAAQASKINNKVDLEIKNPWDVETKTSTASTFDAGWEIVKTTSDGETKLAGAGFDLAVAIPGGDSTDAANKRNALLNNFYNGQSIDGTVAVYDRSKESVTDTTANPWWDMFYQAAISDQFTQSSYSSLDTYAIATNDSLTPEQKKEQLYALAYASDKATDSEVTLAVANGSNHLHDKLISMMRATDYESTGQGVLFFMHKDATTGAYMASMDMGSKDVIMGDVIWTPVAAWATTHLTGDDGYLQYCGLAAGDYALIERQAPKGYTLMNGTVTLGGTTFDNAQAITLGIPGSTISGTSTPASGVINGIADTDGSDIVVKNYEKSIFPLTGGIGIVAFVVAGIMAMAAALYKRKKDMARRD